jgi:phosphopantothenoylcysteine decarboxylase/phosphopantothenate--cysteine ligase
MVGAGRMAEPEEIADAVLGVLGRRHDLAGEVGAGHRRRHARGARPGPLSRQPLQRQDGLRAGRGRAEPRRKVILISGPSALHPPAHCELVKVTTADQMRQAVLERMTEATLVIKAAAVADYRPVAVSEQKLKRTGRSRWNLRPRKTFWPRWCAAAVPASSSSALPPRPTTVMENGRAKLLRKGADAIVVNDVSPAMAWASTRTPTRPPSSRLSTSIELPEMPKRKLADRILDEILTLRRPAAGSGMDEHQDVKSRQDRC